MEGCMPTVEVSNTCAERHVALRFVSLPEAVGHRRGRAFHPAEAVRQLRARVRAKSSSGMLAGVPVHAQRSALVAAVQQGPAGSSPATARFACFVARKG